MGDGPTIEATELPDEIVRPATEVDVPLPPLIPEAELSVEEARIRRALERAAGNRTRAAQMLGLSRVTLWRHMRELGIEE
jgi:transcriptional regulator of acetoin/glycerol metabolism